MAHFTEPMISNTQIVPEKEQNRPKRFFCMCNNFQNEITTRISLILGLFVVVSWISFVVPPDVIPGRMALLITLFLVLVNIFNSVTTNTPKAEGMYQNIHIMYYGYYENRYIYA